MGLTYQMKMKIPFDMADMNGHIKRNFHAVFKCFCHFLLQNKLLCYSVS